MNKFTLIINGRENTRKSERKYTHAVIVIRDIEKARTRAYTWSAEDQKDVQERFDHASEYSTGDWHRRHGFEIGEHHKKQMEEERQIVERGFDAYLAEMKTRKIDYFEEAVKKGEYLWHVTQWSQSEKNARAGARTIMNRGYVQAVEVIDLSKEHSIERDRPE